MHSFDFISGPPKNYIFQKDANKTNLGGVLFTIYMLVIIGISIDYLYDYCKNDKYNIESIYIHNPLKLDDIKKLQQNEKLNPVLNFTFELNKAEGENLSENFEIRNFSNFSQIFYRNTSIEARVSNLKIAIYYKCQDENCTLNMEDESLFNYYISISYQGFTIDHQNKFSPIVQDKTITFSEKYPFFFKRTSLRNLNWEKY